MTASRASNEEEPMGQLDGKVAVITGAASGMGAAAATLFSREGAHVVLADLNSPGGEAAAKAASEAGQRHVFQRTDVSAEDWARTQAVCLRGVFLGIKHSIAPMRAQGGGAIVSTASIAGIDGYPNLHAYCAAKAGVVNLTRSASIEFAADRIRINCIAPGGVSTPILGGGANYNKAATDAALEKAQPLPIAGQPEDIAQAALFLSSDAARFITGHCLVVDGGATAGQIAGAPRGGQGR